jgi:hypothetical protein
MYMYVYLCCVCVCTHTHTHTERERERDMHTQQRRDLQHVSSKEDHTAITKSLNVCTDDNYNIYTHTETTRLAKRSEQATTGSAEDHTEIAKNLNICTDGPGATQDENWVLGFHAPPFQSVQHLHLHCIAPPVQISNMYIYIYIYRYARLSRAPVSAMYCTASLPR